MMLAAKYAERILELEARLAEAERLVGVYDRAAHACADQRDEAEHRAEAVEAALAEAKSEIAGAYLRGLEDAARVVDEVQGEAEQPAYFWLGISAGRIRSLGVVRGGKR